MRRFLFVFLLLLSFTARAASSAPALLAHQRVLVLGDSITQDGRYVSYLEYYLQRFAPDTHSDLISIGLSSETLSGLTEPDHPAPRPCLFDRLDRALELVKPQVVLACYGMNDGIYHPSSPERLAAFTHGLSRLIEKVHAIGAQLVLITPPVFDALPISARTVRSTAPVFGYKHPYNNYDDVLAGFAAAEIAQQAKVSYLLLNHIVPPLPLQGLVDAFLKGTAEVFKGKIQVAKDGDLLSLPAGKKSIDVSHRF